MSKGTVPQFTPAPWQAVGLGNASYFPSVRIGPKYKYEDGSGEGEDLITINVGATPEGVKAGTGSGTTTETADANARLIAAAPSLYHALKLWIDEARFFVPNAIEYDMAWQQAVHALEKAEGKTA